ncbi:hypothetical chaperone protein [Monaibacterium marinum]|uniref:Hypothetical chaperone protein n=1 Tax=Pontivivens marinum TaxID=1690039 RepID=A0A2C9CS61_9RHOB|nr:Hsp70 family protein [Monaibacterium marinum]SOH93219.1 hypothetical chaperone protein [Monaibacterium marinum]
MADDMLAIDFGTSNSAAAVLRDGVPHRLPIEVGADTLPTAVFFQTEGGEMLLGEAASRALIAGDEGRYMRALKSVLGTSLLNEERPIGGRRRTLASIITDFLRVVKQRAEDEAGQTFTSALSGRPVHFHSGDATRDARAESDLRACYKAAGFDEVRFLFEPEAAALASHQLNKSGTLGLIVDIGGGTSDFSVFRTDGQHVDILASHGIRLGGTDFDQVTSMSHVMRHLGHGGELRRTFGKGLLPVPNDIYADLASWAKIPFLYTRDVQRLVDDMVKQAVAPRDMERLSYVIEEQLGHELAFAVERGKIAANGDQDAAIDMRFIEGGLTAPITRTSLNAALTPFANRLREAMEHTFTLATNRPEEIGSVVLVGGSSLMGMVEEQARALCPTAEISRSEAFTAVVDGLAIGTGHL